MIREATVADLPSLMTMAATFRGRSEYAALLPWNGARVAETMGRLIGSNDGVVYVATIDDVTVGMIGMGVIDSHHFSGERIGKEVFWWMDEAFRGGVAGVRLVHFALRWAREQRAALVEFSAPNAEVAALLERMAFVRVETVMQKRLT